MMAFLDAIGIIKPMNNSRHFLGWKGSKSESILTFFLFKLRP